MVSSLIVCNDFVNTKEVSFSGKPIRTENTNRTRQHSMVLIGARKSASGEYFFLMQNWWEGRYFVEFSGEYMYHCDPKITFVDKEINRNLELLPFICDAVYTETSADAAERCYEK